MIPVVALASVIWVYGDVLGSIVKTYEKESHLPRSHPLQPNDVAAIDGFSVVRLREGKKVAEELALLHQSPSVHLEECFFHFYDDAPIVEP